MKNRMATFNGAREASISMEQYRHKESRDPRTLRQILMSEFYFKSDLHSNHHLKLFQLNKTVCLVLLSHGQADL